MFRWAVASILLGGCSDRAISTSGGDGTGDGGETPTADASSSGGESSSQSSPWACDDPRFQCSTPIDCRHNACGHVGGWYDDAGCLFRSCGDHGDCEPGEACYHARDFGNGCLPNNIFCEENVLGQCQCGADPVCGGSHCVPADTYPVPLEEGPSGHGRAERICGADAGLALTFTTDPIACGEDAAPLLWTRIANYIPGNALYAIDGIDNIAFDDADDPATGGRLTLHDENAGLISGEYDLVFDDHEIYGSFVDLPICPCM